jgi:hypothetical protein
MTGAGSRFVDECSGAERNPHAAMETIHKQIEIVFIGRFKMFSLFDQLRASISG